MATNAYVQNEQNEKDRATLDPKFEALYIRFIEDPCDIILSFGLGNYEIDKINTPDRISRYKRLLIKLLEWPYISDSYRAKLLELLDNVI